MSAIFSPPKAPKVKTPTPEEIAAKDRARLQAENEAIRASILERNSTPRGALSLTQPGLAVPIQ
jgi:hypothetical protein